MKNWRRKTESKIELKNCPFCGENVTIKKGALGGTFFYCTNEQECGASMCFVSKQRNSSGTFEPENPIENFNRRAENVQ